MQRSNLLEMMRIVVISIYFSQLFAIAKVTRQYPSASQMCM